MSQRGAHRPSFRVRASVDVVGYALGPMNSANTSDDRLRVAIEQHWAALRYARCRCEQADLLDEDHDCASAQQHSHFKTQPPGLPPLISVHGSNCGMVRRRFAVNN